MGTSDAVHQAGDKEGPVVLVSVDMVYIEERWQQKKKFTNLEKNLTLL